jgi:hypothetical protein
MIILLVLWLWIATVTAGSLGEVTVEWDANTEPDLAGYVVYMGPESRRYVWEYDVGLDLECTITGLVPGVTYYLAATAYDNDENESAYSIELEHTPDMEPDIPEPEPEPEIEPEPYEPDIELDIPDNTNPDHQSDNNSGGGGCFINALTRR